MIFSSNVYEVRHNLGRQLAKEWPVEADVVIPIPDSGNYAALGYSQESGMRVIFMEEFAAIGVTGVVATARRVVGEGPTYISFDIDSLDPAFAPGTGTPEVGGLTTIEAQQLLRGLRGLDLIGGDVVEVSPPFDHSSNTALAGATMMYEMLCIMAESAAHRKGK